VRRLLESERAAEGCSVVLFVGLAILGLLGFLVWLLGILLSLGEGHAVPWWTWAVLLALLALLVIACVNAVRSVARRREL
jgi:hypothetical protein